MKRILLRVSNMHMNEYELTAGSNKWTGLSVLKEMHKDHLHRNVQKLKCRQRTVERMTVIIVAWQSQQTHAACYRKTKVIGMCMQFLREIIKCLIRIHLTDFPTLSLNVKKGSCLKMRNTRPCYIDDCNFFLSSHFSAPLFYHWDDDTTV